MAHQPAFQVAKNVWRIPALPFDFVNIYALVDDEGGVTLVDTGVKNSAARTVAGLAAMGKSVQDVRRIVLTHAHGDHAGNAANLVSEAELDGVAISAIDAPYAANLVSEAELDGVAISAIDAPYARIGQAPARDQSTFMGRLLTRISKPGKDFPAVVVGEEFADGDVLPVAGGLRVVHTPGHTPGHVSLLHEDTGVLITGDSIWNVRKLSFGVRAFCSDIALNRRTAHVLGELDYQVAAFTHGPHVSENAREQVRGYLADAAKSGKLTGSDE